MTKRLVVVELKQGNFKPEYKGQMELYLRWLAKYETETDENPPLGIILCAGKNNEQIELLELDGAGIHVAEYLTVPVMIEGILVALVLTVISMALGLVIGYLPSLYAAYSARERQLLLLDDLTDARITPVSLVRSRMGPDGDTTQLDAMFDEWAAWCAEVYDSHTSLPVLIWFRSKHRGHSWITGLGVVTDAAMAFAARELKLVVEPGGAIALAAALNNKLDLAGKVVAVVVSGGNVDPAMLARAID